MASSLQLALHRKLIICARSFLVVGILLQLFLDIVISQPIPPPDLATCHLPFNLPAAETPFNCCAPPSNQSAIEFHLNQTAPQTLRLRRPAHALGEDYVQKLIRGYELMRALPDDDPRSFRQQANIHCAYCNMVYLQPNTSVYYQVHSSWLFFSFHRWYLYFHERILANLLDDDTFALPFWNYDSPSGSSMPLMYYADHPELFDIIREPTHAPPTVVNLDFNTLTTRPAREQLSFNAHFMYFVMITGGSTQYGFFGQPLRLGEQYPGHGTVEFSPHNTVHAWVGNVHAVGWRDMGSLYAAARDPVFYAHHSNLDRLWDVWKTINPNHTDIDDPDYLDSGFSFYNEDARLVHVRVRDSLDSAKLGYTYEEVENPWLYAAPLPLSHGPAVLPTEAILCRLGEVVSQPCSFVVVRPLQAKSSLLMEPSSSGTHETLVFEGIQVEARDMEARFDVFVNLPTADELTTLGCAEYAGSFSMLPQFVANSTIINHLQMSLHLASLDPIIDRLNLNNEESLIVTIIPRSVSLCSISSLRIILEQPQSYYN